MIVKTLKKTLQIETWKLTLMELKSINMYLMEKFIDHLDTINNWEGEDMQYQIPYHAGALIKFDATFVSEHNTVIVQLTNVMV